MSAKTATACTTVATERADRDDRSPDLLSLFTEAQRLLQAKQGGEALLPLKEILRICPHHPDAFNLASVAFGQLGMFEEAVSSSRQAIALKPDDAGFRLNLANRLNDLDLGDEAIAVYEEALEIAPNHAAALKSYMRCLAGQGRWAEARALVIRLYDHIEDDPEMLIECAETCVNEGDRRHALDFYQKAAESDPERVEWQLQIARIALALQMTTLAKETAERLLQQHENAEMRAMLASIMHSIRNLDAMAEHLNAIPKDDSQAANAANLRGMMLVSQTRIKEGLEAMARTRTLAPYVFPLQATRVMYLNYDPDRSREDLRRDHFDFGNQFNDRLPELPQKFTDRSIDPERKLRIGLVSPDFRAHSVAYFTRPFLDAFDRERLDVIAYAHVPNQDAVTADLRELTTEWRDIVDWNNQRLADEVRKDRVDILVDLAGLTRDSRLLAFTARPAPIQMTYIGYPNTTGLSKIDYRITDGIADPDGVDDDYAENSYPAAGLLSLLCHP